MKLSHLKFTSVALAIALIGCSGPLAQSQSSSEDPCIAIDRVYTPGVRPGEAGRVRVIQRRVPCATGTGDVEPSGFEDETSALRHLARQSFPVELTLHADPAWDPAETVVGRFVVPSEYFDPANPPLMEAIVDGELTTFRAQFFVALKDGRYLSQVEANNQTVQSVHQFDIHGRSDGDSVSAQIEGLSTHLETYYELTDEAAHGLDLYLSRGEPKDQVWVGRSLDGGAVRISCSARLSRLEHSESSNSYGLCTLNFMADDNNRVNVSLPHFQLDEWPVHRREALALIETWRVE